MNNTILEPIRDFLEIISICLYSNYYMQLSLFQYILAHSSLVNVFLKLRNVWLSKI